MTRIRTSRQHSGKDGGKGRRPKEQEGVLKDEEGRWQHIKLYTHNDPAALYRAEKAALQQMRLHKENPDMVAYQDIRLQGEDNVVCTQMYDG